MLTDAIAILPTLSDQDFITLLFKAKNKSVSSRSVSNVKEVLSVVLPLPARFKSAVLELVQRGEKKSKQINNIADFIKIYPS